MSVEVVGNGANDTSQCCAQCGTEKTHAAALQRSLGDSQIKRPPGWLKRLLFSFLFCPSYFFQKNLNEQHM